MTAHRAPASEPITVKTDTAGRIIFTLAAPGLSYLIHVDPQTGDLINDHYGAPASRADPAPSEEFVWGWPRLQTCRELPDMGRGDMRTPAVIVQQSGGSGTAVSAFKYVSHEVGKGKKQGSLKGLPATWGKEEEVSTLKVRMQDEHSGMVAVLNYAVFAKVGAIARSVEYTNKGKEDVILQRAASMCVGLDTADLELVHSHGNHEKEFQHVRRKVEHGTQGFQSLAGYSGHVHNPFFALVSPTTTEETGPAWGFNLIYSGSFAVEVEKDTRGQTRALIGLNPMHLSWKLSPGETFTTPEAVTTYSSHGLGGMSRAMHNLFRHHLSRAPQTLKPRPTLINNWEGTYFDMDEHVLLPIAERGAQLGCKLFVMDDGWFGKGKNARTSDHMGLGDWFPNPDRFKGGLKPFVDKVTSLKVAGGGKMRMGLWFEPEMVNPQSELYEAHPDWALHAGSYQRTEGRNQLVLNLGLKEVQDHLIEVVGDVLASADITYVKWDNNRGMHELPHPSAAHKYMLGLYRVIEALTSRFPHILWEGCASGGGRFDAGLLYYWPQHWLSDNSDGLDRLYIQFGCSIAYPASAMGCHVSAVPNHQTRRTTPFAFRAHVAMMGGAFGFELNTLKLSEEERKAVPGLIELSERVNPLVITGEQYRLVSPWESNWPAVQYTSQDGKQTVLLVYQMADYLRHGRMPPLKLRALDPKATYAVSVEGETSAEGNGEWRGDELLHVGWSWEMRGDCQSKVVFITRK